MRTPLLILAALALAAPAGARAQAAGEAQPTGLTLAQALALAERSNPGYRQATNNLERNDIENRQMWLGLLPNPQLNLLNTGMSWRLQRVGTDNFGNPIPNPEPRMVQSSQSQQLGRLGFNFDFGNVLRMRETAVRAENRDMAAVTELTDLHASVRRAFLDAQERQLAVELEEELLETERRNQEAARLLFQLARADRLDVLEADLAVTEQEEALRQAQANLSNALLALRNAIGDGDVRIQRVAPAPLRQPDPATLDEEALVAAAKTAGPRVRQQEGQIELARRQVSLDRAEWLPTLSFNIAMSRTELDRGGGGAFFQPSPASDWDRTISIGLDFPDVATYFDRRYQTQASQLDVRNAQEQLRQIQLDVEQEVRSSLVALRSASAAVTIQDARVALADERLALQLDSYRLGQGTFLNLQTASDAAAQARRSLLQSRYAYERALISLEQTLGMPLVRLTDLGAP